MMAKRYGIILLTMLLLLMSSAQANTYPLEDPPEWLTERFCVILGDRILPDEDENAWLAAGKHIFYIDFDRKEYERVRVPEDSYLIQAPGCSPTLICRDPAWAPVGEIVGLEERKDEKLHPEAYFDIFQPFQTDPNDSKSYKQFHHGNSCALPACFKILGYVWDDPSFVTDFLWLPDFNGTAYYLKYAARDNELIIQLVKATKDETIVYHEFSYEYPWHAFQWVISEDEKVAWADPDSGRIHIADGKNEVTVQEEYGTSSCMCWQDPEHLIFLNNKGNASRKELVLDLHKLSIYDTKGKTCTELKNGKGTPLEANIVMYGAEMSGNGVLAFGSIFFTHDGWEYDEQITFLSLFKIFCK